ncbi:MAG TPA: hypothetical protein VEQ12_08985 [Candidatus Limnocylindria bacterium]|nr:hypothetical protein [Candidatus Limnocylindria bacterium]
MDLLEVLRRQAARYQCPSCGQSLAECELDLVSSTDHESVVRITCGQCEASRLVVVQAAAWVGESVPVLDQPLSDDPAIDVDDVLDVRLALAGHAGDLKSLLTR